MSEIERVPFAQAFRDKTGGNQKVPKNAYELEGDIPVIDQSQNFIAGYTTPENQMTSVELPVIIFGDHTKAVKYIDFPFALGADGVKVLKVQDRFLPKYLYWILKDTQIPDAGYSRHFKFLKEKNFAKPSIEEQQKIVEQRDLQELIQQKRERQRELLAELEKSVFREMFGDFNENLVKLGDVAEVVSGITKGRKAKEPTRMVPYLAVSNVQAGALKLEVVKEIDATEAEIERYRLKNGDLVLTEGGDHDKLGRGTIWREELPEAIHQNHIFRVRLNEDSGLLPEYVEAYLADNRARAYFLKSAKQTTGIASINKTQLSNLLVPVAAEQRNFIDILYRLNKFTLIRKV